MLLLTGSLVFVLWCVMGASLFFVKKQQVGETENKNSKTKNIFWSLEGILVVFLTFLLKGIMNYVFASHGSMLDRMLGAERVFVVWIIYVSISLISLIYYLIKKDKNLFCKNISRILIINFILISLALISSEIFFIPLNFLFVVAICLWILSELFLGEKNKRNMIKNVIILILIFLIIGYFNSFSVQTLAIAGTDYVPKYFDTHVGEFFFYLTIALGIIYILNWFQLRFGVKFTSDIESENFVKRKQRLEKLFRIVNKFLVVFSTIIFYFSVTFFIKPLYRELCGTDEMYRVQRALIIVGVYIIPWCISFVYSLIKKDKNLLNKNINRMIVVNFILTASLVGLSEINEAQVAPNYLY